MFTYFLFDCEPLSEFFYDKLKQVISLSEFKLINIFKEYAEEQVESNSVKMQCDGAEGFVNVNRAVLKIGIIGGSGLDDPDIFLNRQEKLVTTPYGDPSDMLIEGTIGSVDCVLLPRHGRKHGISPSNINYRANIWALKEAGCTHVIATNACGSLREEYKPGDLAVPNDFIKQTFERPQTFYDGASHSPQGICHLPMFPSFSESMRRVLIQTAKELKYPVHERAIIVIVDGPRYSTRAESNMFRQWGADLVGMTTVPEVVLAKEAGLLYATIAIATDYDCWHDGEDSVSTAQVKKTMAENAEKVKNIIVKAIANIAKEDWTEDIKAAKELVKCNTNVL